MFRSALVLLTIPGFLACPYRCMGYGSGASAPAERIQDSADRHEGVRPLADRTTLAAAPLQAAPRCGCCSQAPPPLPVRPAADEPASPGAPAVPCDGDCACLCKGAVDSAPKPPLEMVKSWLAAGAISVFCEVAKPQAATGGAAFLRDSLVCPATPLAGAVLRFELGSLLL